MPKSLTFTIPGAPCAKRRHRTVPMSRCVSCQKMTMGNYHQCKYCGGQLAFVSNTAYSDADTVKYENLVAFCAKQAMVEQGVERFSGSPLRMVCKFYLPIPESRRCKKHPPLSLSKPTHPPALAGILDVAVTEIQESEARLALSMCKKLHEGDWHAQRPDVDNLSKSIFDGMNAVAWADDAVIAAVSAEKMWSNDPRVEVVVEEL